ncbi:uncharacterized protein EDB91DRAFT_1337099 [Suillus paluster]|uniref:uncharacterized protein n=1 Tax=Suillus paluster TaxID=48578 RepID=UPI001B86B766|nr:uncharacterized protein EDB91DRAFT_1337099 [Suillus paluster]KAG1738455.1 hypothetical protein EDB91DRAFT_1337099 [Suillus paluster]
MKVYITIKFGQDLILISKNSKIHQVLCCGLFGTAYIIFHISLTIFEFLPLFSSSCLYPSLGVDVVGAGTGAGALNSALFPPAPSPNYFRIFDHLASLFSDSHFLLSNPLLLAPFPPLPSRIFAIFTICSLASSPVIFAFLPVL